MLHVIQSNKMEVLQAQLIHRLVMETVGQSELANVLSPDTIIVQSPGMAQWLKIEIANTLGIAANLEFPLPSSYIWQLYQHYFDDLPDTSAFTKANMAWKLMSLLPAFLDQPEFSQLQAYLEDDEGLKLYQLCQKIADVFDQYQVYRPEWIIDWEQGKSQIDQGALTEHVWQPILWQALVEQTQDLGESAYHRANLHQQLLTRISASKPAAKGKPLYIFGISTLPQQQLQVFEALSEHTDVFIFWCNPSHHYWGDLIDQQQLSRLKLRESHTKHPITGYFDVGNPLLASWGKPGRDYLDMLIASSAQHDEQFHDTAPDTLLEWIQNEIYQLTMRSTHERLEADELLTNGKLFPKIAIAADDTSLQFHCCHSKIRELEVLHDHLLQAFAIDPTLKPADIVVMMPDVAAYAAYIEGVFGSVEANHFIPYGISDRNALQESAIIESFVKLMDIQQSRLTLSELLSLLEVPAIQRRFEISDDAYQDIRYWLLDSGYRWGWDAQDKTRWQVPEELQNTLLFGLQRLLTGYAMSGEHYFYPSEPAQSADVISPYHDIEGQTAAALGKLYQFALAIKDVIEFCSSEATLSCKVSASLQFIERFFEVDDNEQIYLNQLRQALENILSHQQQYPHSVNHDVFVAELKQNLQDKGVGQRFLAGAVNFCTLMPMRSIPFKHVCLLGMDDNAYPRQTVPVGFDLMRCAPTRKGDRSRRMDDRYLFLEALISTRKQLYISYQGLDARDNSPRNPSILVSELLEYCGQVFCLQGDQAADPETTQKGLLHTLQFEHGLQPFDEKYYLHANKLTTSFNQQWRHVLEAQVGGVETSAFASKPLPASTEKPSTVIDLDQLLAFYDNPIKYFLKHRFGASLDIYTEEIQDDEPFILSPLAKYQLTDQVIALLKTDPSLSWDEGAIQSELALRWRSQGKLASGKIGDEQLNQVFSANRDFLKQIAAYVTDQQNHPIEIAISLSTVVVNGWLIDGYGEELILYRAGKIRAKDRLALWIKWLAVCVQSPGRFVSAKFMATDKQFALSPVSQQDASVYLENLLEIFHYGLNQPLMLFPQTAMKWLDTQNKRKTFATFYGDDFTSAEGQDANIKRICANLDQQFDDFLFASDNVMQPIFSYETA